MAGSPGPTDTSAALHCPRTTVGCRAVHGQVQQMRVIPSREVQLPHCSRTTARLLAQYSNNHLWHTIEINPPKHTSSFCPRPNCFVNWFQYSENLLFFISINPTPLRSMLCKWSKCQLDTQPMPPSLVSSMSGAAHDTLLAHPLSFARLVGLSCVLHSCPIWSSFVICKPTMT